jgi:hypothetical protein
MVFGLRFDVLHGNSFLRPADGERTITFLPGESFSCRKTLMDPLRRTLQESGDSLLSP